MIANKEDKFYLSASKIDKFHDCSALYAARYLFNVPDKSNDGANRGSVVHDLLELLLKKKHLNKYQIIIYFNTCKKVPVIWRYIRLLARKYNVCDNTNLDMIDDFIIVALKNNFFGPKNTKEVLGEKEFNVCINDGSKKYSIRGFIDKTFIVNSKKGLTIECVDYKSSKAKFDKLKLTNNRQSLMYQLALRHLYPHIKDRKFDFLFLKFPKDPVQSQPSFDDKLLDGFEIFLTDVQKTMENFSVKNIRDNLAGLDNDRRWLCGREGNKKDGTPNFICPVRKPIHYFVLLDENKKVIKSAFLEKDLELKDCQKIEYRYWSGCPLYFNENGQRRNFS